jgi:1-acyl-sn-glycerol-3-phosphate acyltransferase
VLQNIRSFLIWLAIASITTAMYVVGAPVFLLTAPFDPLRRIGHWYATRWGRLMFNLNGRWSCAAYGQEHIPRDRPLVVVANHQAVSDIMALYHLDLHYKWISKAANFLVPCMGWFMFHAGYIPLRRGKKDSILRCMERARWYLDRGVSILFFAEGTRSKDGQVLPFKPGAFKLALEGQFDILPVGIGGTSNAIPKHSWKFSEELTPMKVVVGEPISTRGLTDADLPALIERARAAVIALKADADARIAHDLSSKRVDPLGKPVLEAGGSSGR